MKRHPREIVTERLRIVPATPDLTLPSLAPSIRVLEKLGFMPAAASEDGVIAFELDQPSA